MPAPVGIPCRPEFVWTPPASDGYRRAVAQTRRYRYVGPAELRDLMAAVGVVAVGAPASLDGWLTGRGRSELGEPFTFVVALDGILRLAPRRSEHVALAGGRDVLAAGEMTFASTESGRDVAEVTNQSSGYCPDPDSWPAVASALDRAGVQHPATSPTRSSSAVVQPAASAISCATTTSPVLFATAPCLRNGTLRRTDRHQPAVSGIATWGASLSFARFCRQLDTPHLGRSVVESDQRARPTIVIV